MLVQNIDRERLAFGHCGGKRCQLRAVSIERDDRRIFIRESLRHRPADRIAGADDNVGRSPRRRRGAVGFARGPTANAE